MNLEQLKQEHPGLFDKKVTPEVAAQIKANYIKRLDTQYLPDHYVDCRGRTGVFRIIGDDQSGSYHSSHTPTLAYLSGRFEDVLEAACYMQRFTYWSKTTGGRIEPLQIINV
jgi:hypothetical protein